MQDALSYSCHREVQDLYHAWLLANDAADNSHDQLSRNDKNLLAIAQLAALKLRMQHAIVSLLDGESQHILAETTQTRSLSHGCDDIPSDFTSRLLLDAFYAQRNLANSIPSSEQGSSQEPDHFVSTDCRTDDRFKDHAFVKREGGVRFALGVPLISKNTHRIGVLLVLDGSPRRMVEDTDLLDLKDCAQCVVRHLELVHSSVRATKGTNILRGIAECFPNQYQALEDQEQQGNSEDSKRSDSGAGERTVKFEDDDNTDLDDSPRSIEASFQAAFDGVARMLRDRSMANGAVIFGPPAVANLMTMEDDDTSPNEFEERCGKKPSSSLLASSLRDGVVCPAIGNLKAPPICILNRLASLYPRGMIFGVAKDNVTEQAPTSKEQWPPTDAIAQETEKVLALVHTEILNNFADARTLMYLPVYDQDSRSLLASCFMWSQDDGLHTGNDHQEISDYHVLGNFLSHNVAQLRMQNKDAEQRKFVSNFSHELRTPINGILGSAQFLQDTVSDDYQNELLQSIVVSSNTLLDTLNIVLDFTKFEHAITEVKNPSTEEGTSSALPAPVQPFYVEADVDLALLVEDATETVVAGHFFDNLPPDTDDAGVVDRSYDCYRARQGIDRGTTQDVKVILQLSARPSWSVKTSPGAISRVVMNLVGNALKFTQTGNIVVELEPKNDGDDSKVEVRLRIGDSGIGMTEHFVKHHLFVPYRQGNSFSPGVGLGMSVLKHMVSSLHGELSISSKVGKGTTVNVDLTLDACEHSDDGIPADLQKILSRIKGKHLVLLDINNICDDKQKGAVMRRAKALQSVATDWLGLRVSTSKDINVDDADFYLFSEPPPVEVILKRHQRAAKEHSANMEVPLIVVATNSREAHYINRNHAVSLEKTGRIVQVLSQPCGPRKLAKVLNLCQDRVEQSKKDRACREDDGDSTEHRPSEAEPDTDRDQYGNAEDGQTVEDMDGPPSVSGTQPAPKKVSRLSHNGDSGYEGDDSKRQENVRNEHRSNDEPTEAGADAQSPEAQVPKPPFTKPLVLSRSPADAAPQDQNKVEGRNLHGLCVDDNKINLRLLVTLMRREKHTYEQSENGQEALEAFKASNGPESSDGENDSRQPFDFVLMDIGMPVMNGIQCTKAIREHERKHNLPPTYIVACTAWRDGKTQRKAKEAGMDAFLPKPLKFVHLKELLAGLRERE